MILTVISAVLMLFQTAMMPADSSGINELTVQKALEIAYQKNPQINQLKNRIDAQQRQEVLSIGIDNPEISYFKEGLGQGGFAEQRWTVSQRLDFPLSSLYRVKQEKATTESMRQQLRDLQNQVKADVKAAYAQLSYALQTGQLAEERVSLSEDLREAAKARSEMGEASGIDAMQADLQLQESRNSLETVGNKIMNARYDLFQSIGLDPEEQTYGITFPDTLGYVMVTINQDEVMNMLENHPMLKQLQQEVEASNFREKMAKSRYLPDLNLKYYQQDYGNNFDFHGFEVGVKVPLWFATNQHQQVQQANALQKATEWKLEDARLLIKKQAEQTWHSYESAKNNIERFRSNIQQQSQDLVHMTQRGYSLGELDLLTLLEAQRTYLRTQEAYYQTLRDYYLTIIDLERFLQSDIIFN